MRKPNASRSLLETLQTLIERTYGMQTGVRDLHRFIVGDRGLERVYGERRVVEQVGAAQSAAKVLLRESADGLFANIYYPDALIASLEESNPLCGLDARNLDLFAVFVEELDHFLTVAERVRQRRPFSLFELELHANVTKYLTCRHFLSKTLRRPLSRGEHGWLTWSLFEKWDPPSQPGPVRDRYRDADRLARRYADDLARRAPRARLAEVRAFHRRSVPDIVRRIEHAARPTRSV